MYTYVRIYAKKLITRHFPAMNPRICMCVCENIRIYVGNMYTYIHTHICLCTQNICTKNTNYKAFSSHRNHAYEVYRTHTTVHVRLRSRTIRAYAYMCMYVCLPALHGRAFTQAATKKHIPYPHTYTHIKIKLKAHCLSSFQAPEISPWHKPGSKLVPKPRFAALNYYENGSIECMHVIFPSPWWSRLDTNQ